MIIQSFKMYIFQRRPEQANGRFIFIQRKNGTWRAYSTGNVNIIFWKKRTDCFIKLRQLYSTGWKILPLSLSSKNFSNQPASSTNSQTILQLGQTLGPPSSLIAEKPDLLFVLLTSYNDPFPILSKFSRLTLYSTNNHVSSWISLVIRDRGGIIGSSIL